MHKSTISKKMNLLYVAVDPGLYTHYSASEAYPANEYPFPADVDEVPDFSACNNDNDRATAKITHMILLKTHDDVVNRMLPSSIPSLASSQRHSNSSTNKN